MPFVVGTLFNSRVAVVRNLQYLIKIDKFIFFLYKKLLMTKNSLKKKITLKASNKFL